MKNYMSYPVMIAKHGMRFFTEGWYFRGDEQSRNRRNHLFVNYTSTIIANIIGMSFFTGLLINMGADDGFIGLMAMMPIAANMLQVFAPLLLERFPQRRKLLMYGRLFIFILNIALIGLIPLFPVTQQMRLAMMAAAVLLVNLLNAFFAPGVSVWFISFTPQSMRARFFSVIMMTNGILAALAALGAGSFVDMFKARGMELTGLQAMRGIALALALVDFFLVRDMKEYPYENTGGIKIKQLLVEPFRERLYLRTVMIAFLWSLTASIPGAYYSVYLLKDLGVSYSFLMIVGFFNVPLLLLLTPVWERILRRHSWFKTLTIAMGLFLVHYILLAFVTETTVLFMYPIAVLCAFMLAPGINLAFANIPYVNIPVKNQTLFIGFYSSLANFGAFVGISIGNGFISVTHGRTINLMGVEMGNKQYLMLLVSGAMLAAVFLIHLLSRKTEGKA